MRIGERRSEGFGILVVINLTLWRCGIPGGKTEAGPNFKHMVIYLEHPAHQRVLESVFSPLVQGMVVSDLVD